MQNTQTNLCLQRPNQFPLTSSKRSFKFRWRLRRRTADSCNLCSLPGPCSCLLTLPAKEENEFHKITALLKNSCQSTRAHSRPADVMHPGNTLFPRDSCAFQKNAHQTHPTEGRFIQRGTKTSPNVRRRRNCHAWVEAKTQQVHFYVGPWDRVAQHRLGKADETQV